jgi:hypothetical protein
MSTLPSTGDSILLETTVLSVVRLAFFLACRQYVNISLFSDLRNVIREDGNTTDLEDPDGDSIELEDAENGYFGLSSGAGSSGAAGAAGGSKPREDGLGAALSRKGTGLNRRDSNGGAAAAAAAANRASGLLYSRLASALFCLSVSESCMLFTLLIFGEAVSERCVSLFLSFRQNEADLFATA